MEPAASILLAIIVAALFTVGWITGRHKHRYLPGPRGWPIIGNLLQVPTLDPWETYTEWKNLYGDAVYVNVLGNKIVILNTYQACSDLMEKRSDIYSDRPIALLCRIIMGWERALSMAPYGDHWRRTRRIAAQSLRKDMVKEYLEVQQDGVVKYLMSLLHEPEKFAENIRFASGYSLLKTIYGIDVRSSSDPIITTVEEAVDHGLNAMTPGNFLVDFFPPLKYVPDWMPGTNWKKYAAQGRKLCDEMANVPFDRTVADMAKGSYNHSLASSNLQSGEDPYVVKWCSGTMYAAGTDTTVGIMHNFIFAILLHPVVQRRAQAEIDSVVGNGRLPTISDRANLPYLNCVMKEVLRWHPVLPLGMPHHSMQDDVYRDRFIPKGSMILGNIWAITRDESLYESPEIFNPDRFMPLFDDSVPRGPLGMPLDPDKYIYGFGRRICVGVHYADAMLFLLMANVLACFDIHPLKDAEGKDMFPPMKFISSMVREPAPFQCSITARSSTARSLIETYTSV